ncbi:DNA polymerase III subunit alpha [Pacificimonas flava]|uniref:DNA polymerase III subunit alpha n=2 Tax=Pacificimonas TaxID=1960290 RepID=A0A219B7N2_9SPHN|nr:MULTISPECIES: DNA polymerase III subunit alpha [Pacificimonas]MBZ6378608.1 DNA polymerase III subunit alpha [Pacificimonas aurantium]OWV34116.1 DNA polymerase III subunit alpha [Pacificimonas flava]
MPDPAEETAAPAPYIPLRCFSSYSMLEGAIHPGDLAARCRELGFPAAALTDRSNMFSAMEVSTALAGAGVQPIMGAMLAVERPGAQPIGGTAVKDWLVLLAQNERGYGNLIELLSHAHLGSDPTETAHVDLDRLEQYADGLICLTAGAEGALARLLAEEQAKAARVYLEELADMFGDRLYIEICRTGDPVEAASEVALIELALERGLPLVATNPAAFLDRDFSPAHDVMLCIASSTYTQTQDRPRTNPELWLKSGDVMRELFKDLPEAIANTAIVAQRCAVMAPQRKPILPSLAGDPEAEVSALRDLARAGLEKRLKVRPSVDRDAYFKRLDYELGIIEKMGFPGYFLIVADFIQWAKDKGIPVGPGRGSGAGSVVAWSLTITDLDPIELGLLFERFLNPERVSMPDFDIDFCETRRGEVIRYVQERYGRDQVAQIITFGKLKARAVIKDVGRVLQMPFGMRETLAGMIDNNPAKPQSLKEALDANVDLSRRYKREEDVRRLIDLALQLEGMPRHSSTHAAGVVIGDRPLSQLVPLYRDPRSDMPVTQFDMKWVEQAGLVKFDFLGLKTLSVIHYALDLIERRTGTRPDLAKIDWTDEETYALMARGDTLGVFQLESDGMRDTLAKVKPDTFADIIALISLYRPGPMDSIPQFANRKHGREQPDYLHPRLEQYLTETYGVIIYQEQVMQIAQELAGYSLGEADLLRRAMGKKKPEEMAKQKERFLSGAKEQGVDPKQADYIFELVAKFAGYGFNKSHAAAYALIAYQTAWLKAHFPAEFYAASMQFDMGQTEKLGIFLDDARRLGVECLPPDINASAERFVVETGEDGQNRLRYALAALKGVGTKAMEQVVRERSENGDFTSLTDFANRVDPKLLNTRQLERLAAAGAFDELDANRAAVFGMASSLLAVANSAAEQRATQQGALFGGGGGGAGEISLIRPKSTERWSLSETMEKELDSFGFYFSAHPLSAYAHILKAKGAKTYARYVELGGPPGGGKERAVLGAKVEASRKRVSQNGGKPFLALTLSDQDGQFSGNVYEEDVQKLVEEARAADEPVLIQGELNWRPGYETPFLRVSGAVSLPSLDGKGRTVLKIDAGPDAVDQLSSLLVPGSGRGEAEIRIPLKQGGTATLKVGGNLSLDSELVHHLSGLDGISDARLDA